MKILKMNEMVRGWLVGNFNPTAFKTNDVEVGVKLYKSGDHEEEHYHKIATEITVIVSGVVEMKNKRYVGGDIIIIEPYESTDFRCIEDTVTTVVKIPGANDDKYMGRSSG